MYTLFCTNNKNIKFIFILYSKLNFVLKKKENLLIHFCVFIFKEKIIVIKKKKTLTQKLIFKFVHACSESES
jgi:hypothetical protein